MSFSVRRFAMSLCIVSLGMAASSAYAQAEKKAINAMTTFKYPPFEFYESNGKPAGLSIDVMNALASKMGVQVNWVESSFTNIVSFAPLKTQRADVLISSITDTPERRAGANFVDY